MYIQTKSMEDRSMLITILLGIGYKWHGEYKYTTADAIEAKYPFNSWATINVNRDRKYISGNFSGDKSWPEDKVEILEHITNIVHESSIVKLPNIGDYEVSLDKKTKILKVGCQEISVDKLKEIGVHVNGFNQRHRVNNVGDYPASVSKNGIDIYNILVTFVQFAEVMNEVDKID